MERVYKFEASEVWIPESEFKSLDYRVWIPKSWFQTNEILKNPEETQNPLTLQKHGATKNLQMSIIIWTLFTIKFNIINWYNLYEF